MKVIICGDRNYSDYKAIKEFLKNSDVTCVVQGEAPGADSLAKKAALELGIEVLSYPANWSALGKKAGPIRNAQMLSENPDVRQVIAFHDDFNASKGTKHMINHAAAKGYDTRVVEKKK